ncbi:transcriptional repressor LexA [Ectothiorhodospiraceae bacterium 2226]|nr:transcriptional repressor LexA [Ectothiorhodospiraceae bacterium 2226]
MQTLTPRQLEVLEYIQSHVERTGSAPTRSEIAQALGFRSLNAAEGHLKALARKGAIELVGGTSRGIRVLGGEAGGLPVVGRVAAGSPLLAQEHIERHYRLDPALFTPRAHYLLRVQGASMRDAGILDGDLLAVHRTPTAENGQIVVARLDDEVTVKRYRRQGNVVHLLPENPEFEPIVVHLARQAFAIEGVGVGVIRHGHVL